MLAVVRGLGLIMCACLALHATPALVEKRVPLAIGNGKYTRMAGLPNVRDDAGAMALLKAAKFDDVALLHNLDTARLLAPLKAFALKAADADVAAPFYAGHGMEVGGASPSSNSHFYHELR